jgi:hypothetical protein
MAVPPKRAAGILGKVEVEMRLICGFILAIVLAVVVPDCICAPLPLRPIDALTFAAEPFVTALNISGTELFAEIL